MCAGTISSRHDDLAGPVFTLYGVPPAGGHGEGCLGCLSIGMTIPPHWGLAPGLWGGISAARGRSFGVISSARGSIPHEKPYADQLRRLCGTVSRLSAGSVSDGSAVAAAVDSPAPRSATLSRPKPRGKPPPCRRSSASPPERRGRPVRGYGRGPTSR